MKYLIVFLLIINSVTFCQLIDSIKINQSTTNAYWPNMAYSNNNVAVTYQRGNGTSLADQQIMVLTSTDKGVTFKENNVTISTATKTYEPAIAISNSVIKVLYCYEENSVQKVGVATSTNSGSTFTLATITDADFVYAAWCIDYYDFSFKSSNSKFYLAASNSNYLFVLTNNTNGFIKKALPPTNNYFANHSRLCSNSSNSTIYCAYFYHTDTLQAYKTSNDGTSFQKMASINIPQGMNYTVDYDCISNNNNMYIFYAQEEVGMYNIYMATIDPSNNVSQKLIYSSEDLIWSVNVKNLNNSFCVETGDRVIYSSNSGTTWSQPFFISSEMENHPTVYDRYSAVDIVNDTTLFMLIRKPNGNLANLYLCKVQPTDKPYFLNKVNAIIYWNQFEWKNYIPCSSNEFQLSNSSNFSNIIYDTTIVNDHYLFANLYKYCINNSQYYCRIRGANSGNYTQWSSTYNFSFNLTAIKDNKVNENSFELAQNYPNPFNPSTTINYTLAREGNVKLTIYSSVGCKVATIVNDYKPAGNYSIQFNAGSLASGIYLYRLESGFNTVTKKFILIK